MVCGEILQESPPITTRSQTKSLPGNQLQVLHDTQQQPVDHQHYHLQLLLYSLLFHLQVMNIKKHTYEFCFECFSKALLLIVT